MENSKNGSLVSDWVQHPVTGRWYQSSVHGAELSASDGPAVASASAPAPEVVEVKPDFQLLAKYFPASIVKAAKHGVTELDREREALRGLRDRLSAEFDGMQDVFLATLSDSQRLAYFNLRDAGRACRLSGKYTNHSFTVAELAKARKRWMADRA